MLNTKLSPDATSAMARQFIAKLRDRFDGGFLPELADAPGRQGRELLFPLDGIDVEQTCVSRERLAESLPHRGEMLLLDHIAWIDRTGERALAVKRLRQDEFWVAGHFPDKPVMPGVLMVEAGAQLALYLCQQSQPKADAASLLRIEQARFRHAAAPGDTLLLLCRLAERQRGRFCYDIQGRVGQRIAFDARIVGWPGRGRQGWPERMGLV